MIPNNVIKAIDYIVNTHSIEDNNLSAVIQAWKELNQGLFENPVPDFKTVCDFLVDKHFSFFNRYDFLIQVLQRYHELYPAEVSHYLQKLFANQLADEGLIYLKGVPSRYYGGESIIKSDGKKILNAINELPVLAARRWLLLGHSQIRESNSIAAVPFFKMAAEKGSIEAQYILGIFYENGQGGLTQDKERAINYFKLAARQGYTKAQGRVGTYYDQYYDDGGRDLESLKKNTEKARAYYELAAQQGEATSQCNLAVFYEQGLGGLTQDYNEAYIWNMRAAQQGQADAQCNLGLFYENGRGRLQKDYIEALRWYFYAAQQGQAAAQYKLGYYYELGLGALPQDSQEALKWYKKAAQQNYSIAVNALQRLTSLCPTSTAPDLQGTSLSSSASSSIITHTNNKNISNRINIGTLSTQAPVPSIKLFTAADVYSHDKRKKITAPTLKSNKSQKTHQAVVATANTTTLASSVSSSSSSSSAFFSHSQGKAASNTIVVKHEERSEADILKEVKILRGKSTAKSNCAQLVEGLMRYFRSGIHSTQPAKTRAASINAGGHETVPGISLPAPAVKIEPIQETSEASDCVQQSLVYYNETGLNSMIPLPVHYQEDNTSGAVQSYVDLTAHYTTQTRVSYTTLNERLLKEADNNGGVAYGTLTLISPCDECDHVIAFYATRHKVLYIDAQLYNGKTGKGHPIFETLPSIYDFSSYSEDCFYLVHDPLDERYRKQAHVVSSSSRPTAGV